MSRKKNNTIGLFPREDGWHAYRAYMDDGTMEGDDSCKETPLIVLPLSQCLSLSLGI